MASEKRLIDMGNFLEVLRRYLNSSHVRKSGPVCCGMRIAIRSCIELLESQKPVDAVEVVHGRWEKASEKMPIYRCSICKERNLFKNGYNVFSNYCPNCGAKMDGERKDK